MRAIIVALACMFTAPALAQEGKSLPPHEHGAGKVNIAIDGKTVSIEVNAPADDIVGFEHAPKNDKERKAIEVAKASLGKPLSQIVFPKDAGCVQKTAKVEFDTGEPSPAGKQDAQHADFDIEYELECSAPEKITALTFAYFKNFANGQKLTVTVVRPDGQTQFEVTRAKPSVTLPKAGS